MARGGQMVRESIRQGFRVFRGLGRGRKSRPLLPGQVIWYCEGCYGCSKPCGKEEKRDMEKIVDLLTRLSYRVLFVGAVVFLVSCGPQTDEKPEQIIEPTANVYCTVLETELGADITCPDGTQVSIRHGAKGTDGARGPAGENGKDGIDGSDGVAGTDGVNGTNGQDGIDGQDGAAGANGVNGEDGQDGADGVDGADAINPTFIGQYCDRAVFTMYGTYYISSTRLRELTTQWYKTPSGCKIKLVDGQIITQ